MTEVSRPGAGAAPSEQALEPENRPLFPAGYDQGISSRPRYAEVSFTLRTRY